MANGAPSGDHPVFGQTGFDPSQPHDAVAIAGYHADLGDILRIYVDLNLCEWVDVPKDAIVASVVDDDNILVPCLVWVERTATVVQGSSETTDVQYLKGQISDRELGRSSSWGGPVMTPFCSGTHTIVPMCSGTHH